MRPFGMAVDGMTDTGVRRAPWEVSVESQHTEVAPDPVHVCFVGLQPAGTTLVSDALPTLRVARAEGAFDGGSWERLRFRAADPLDALPGLEGRNPSRLRDSVRLGLTAGSKSVDVVLGRLPDHHPWDLADPALVGLLSDPLDQVGPSCVVFPDAGGPPGLAGRPGGDHGESWARVIAVLGTWGERMTENWQLGLADAPPGEGPEAVIGRDLPSVDFSLCRWSGGAEAMRAQGWRCAAAAVAGALGSLDVAIMRPIARRPITLGVGRKSTGAAPESRAAASFPGESRRYITLHVDAEGRSAQLIAEPTLRQPAGAWSIGALRTAKVLHRRIVMAANLMVFRPAHPASAFALVVALNEAMSPFIQLGLLTGPGSAPTPAIDADVSDDRDAPGLIASIDGALQPWCHEVKIRVSVRSGGTASVLVQP